ncbi:MAG TPA: ATP-binding protein [Terriglobia bacterium]|nr:ATP-binding protein [Terriglobia bacterium]
MMPGKFGLQTKIIIIFATAVFVLVGISTVLAMFLTRQPVEEEVYRRALTQARLTAHNLVNDNALNNPQTLVRILKQMQHDVPGVKQSDVYLHDPNHTLIATTDPAGPHLELDHIPGINDTAWANQHLNEFERADEDQYTIETPHGKYWIIATVLRVNGRIAGCLTLKVSKLRSNVITLDIVEGNLLLLLASLVVLILAVHGFFLRSVRGPVKEMIRVMEVAEGGQLDVRARVQSHDEIGQLADHLNDMLARIQNFNSDLGRKVREATSELAHRNVELTRINEELFETQKSLARSERLAVAGQLAASLAHEIGTPLNSISGHVQLMVRRKTGDEGFDRRLHIIEKQIENIVRTVKQLLSWTRKFDLHLERIDLRHVIEEAAMLSSPVLELKKIDLHTESAPDCPAIFGDAGYLQQVFLNLINNSMDAMPRGGSLKIRLSYAASGDPAQVTVELEDSGEGIAEETLLHIFDPMFTTKRMGTGAGLGLAICDQIVRQHGGEISVRSKPHQGTCFTISLPVDCRDRVEAPLIQGAGVSSSRS